VGKAGYTYHAATLLDVIITRLYINNKRPQITLISICLFIYKVYLKWSMPTAMNETGKRSEAAAFSKP
jgi:hypothetical protein